MERVELNSDKNIEILQEIKEVILNKYPIIDDRFDIITSYPRPAIDIDINFYNDDENIEATGILFCAGTEVMKTSIPERLVINGLISPKIVIDLISFIISDHNYIKNITRTDNQIKLIFDIKMTEENMCGMSVGEIGLELDFHKYLNHENLLNSYLKEIVNTFYEQLKETDSFKKEYAEYCLLAKEKVINSFNEQDLQMFMELLSNEDICRMLLDMPNNRFIELYSIFKNKEKVKIK